MASLASQRSSEASLGPPSRVVALVMKPPVSPWLMGRSDAVLTLKLVGVGVAVTPRGAAAMPLTAAEGGGEVAAGQRARLAGLAARKSRVASVPDLLDGQVGLDLDCLDRVYLNGYVRTCKSVGRW